ncbi:hypothetical protein ACVWXN_007371 [Bradyrhizobium sp. i1.4.4]
MAIPALDHLEIEPGFLHLRACERIADMFDGGDGAVRNRADRQDTGAHGLAVDMHRAGTALRDAAAEFRARHSEDVAQHPQQRHFRRRVERFRFAVDGESCCHMHPLARLIACGDLVGEFVRDNNHTDAKR